MYLYLRYISKVSYPTLLVNVFISPRDFHLNIKIESECLSDNMTPDNETIA